VNIVGRFQIQHSGKSSVEFKISSGKRWVIHAHATLLGLETTFSCFANEATLGVDRSESVKSINVVPGWDVRLDRHFLLDLNLMVCRHSDSLNLHRLLLHDSGSYR